MESKAKFSRDIIQLENIELVVERICSKLKEDVFHVLRRKGGVWGLAEVSIRPLLWHWPVTKDFS